MLNPIEGCFRVFKAKVKAFLAVHLQRIHLGKLRLHQLSLKNMGALLPRHHLGVLYQRNQLAGSTFGFEPLQRDAAICICYVYSRYWQVGTLQKSPLMFILLGAQHKLIYTEVTVWFLQQF
ncbi:hypothetical protein PC122_g10459 [Phytophthora cactorum]|nr:hypothetical protein PC122_g10459 [Phytophthora cactorum]